LLLLLRSASVEEEKEESEKCFGVAAFSFVVVFVPKRSGQPHCPVRLFAASTTQHTMHHHASLSHHTPHPCITHFSQDAHEFTCRALFLQPSSAVVLLFVVASLFWLLRPRREFGLPSQNSRNPFLPSLCPHTAHTHTDITKRCRRRRRRRSGSPRQQRRQVAGAAVGGGGVVELREEVVHLASPPARRATARPRHAQRASMYHPSLFSFPLPRSRHRHLPAARLAPQFPAAVEEEEGEGEGGEGEGGEGEAGVRDGRICGGVLRRRRNRRRKRTP
jgi:hypothetical protein